jgi:Protein of unknown function (DUF3761)
MLPSGGHHLPMVSRMQRATIALVVLVLGVAGVVVVMTSSSNSSIAPSGATALCNDGAYSYVHVRSAMCSRHGGVSVLL